MLWPISDQVVEQNKQSKAFGAFNHIVHLHLAKQIGSGVVT